MSSNEGNKRSYSTLCKVLDSLRAEAPPSDSTYNPDSSNHNAIINARSKALLHLFLKARFGLIDFNDREKFVTDGIQDGGIDAFYIDQKLKKIYLIQSKFRKNAENFAKEKIDINDLLKMQVKRILNGERLDENNLPYNEKITKGLQKAIRNLPNIGEFDKQIILLGNAEHLKEIVLTKIIDGYPTEQFPHNRTYSELLFPVINGTYFSDPNLTIEINLSNLKGDSHLDYDAKSESLKTNIKLLFVPTLEIGRIMSTYRNSILKYNPRSFLELETNPVNKDIERSIKDNSHNEFALFNNGITIVANRTRISTDTAKQGKAQAVLQNPQLINGGQTAYTLGRIYEECKDKKDFSIFKNKEVLVRIITFPEVSKSQTKNLNVELISEISKASNSQTKIDESDRRSNDEIQITLQKVFFEKYGLYYERKRGEFSDGKRAGYITENIIVSREKLVAVALAGEYKASQARANKAKYFKKETFESLLKTTDVERYAFGYEVLMLIDKLRKEKPIDKKDRYTTSRYGQALRYGQSSVVAVCMNQFSDKSAQVAMDFVLAKWIAFEKWAVSQPTNNHYSSDNGFDYANYYKGSTINNDLKNYRFA